MKKKGALLLVFTHFLFLVGCQSTRPKAAAWDLVVTKTTPASIEVDLIAISEFERSAWEGYDMDQYWAPGDSRRANADKLTRSLQADEPWVVNRSDPQWQKWLSRGATELLVLANLPGRFPPGSTDPRRIFLPLDKSRQKTKSGRWEIEVQDTIVRPHTP